MRGRKAIMKPADRMEMRLMREAGVSIKDAAGYFNVSMATAMRVLADLRTKLGPENFKARDSRQRARAHLYTSQNITSGQQM
jgi:hypothetical protein